MMSDEPGSLSATDGLLQDWAVWEVARHFRKLPPEIREHLMLAESHRGLVLLLDMEYLRHADVRADDPERLARAVLIIAHSSFEELVQIWCAGHRAASVIRAIPGAHNAVLLAQPSDSRQAARHVEIVS